MGSNVLNSFGPGVKRGAPVAARLNSYVIYTTDYTEETIFSPMSAPRISYVPELDSVFFAPTNDRDFVDCVKITSCVVVDSAYIVIERLRDSN